MLGWCIGAILSTIYAALRLDDDLKNLLLLTAPLDFTDKQAGGFVRWVNDQAFDPDKIIDALTPGSPLARIDKTTEPVVTIEAWEVVTIL
jgi:polyhydroxyalkanoate synthase subunit PhaC